MKRLCEILSLVVLLFIILNVNAGNIAPPGGPTDATGQMFTTTDIYNRLNEGTTGTKKTTFTEPTAGPSNSGKTLDEIMSKAPVKDNVNGASPTDVLLGQSYWGLKDGNWGLQTGSIKTRILSDTTTTIIAGYYEEADLRTIDTNLTSDNIKAGITIFGIAGKTEVVDTTETVNPATARDIVLGKNTYVNGTKVTGSAIGLTKRPLVAKTGQTTSYAIGDDGDSQKGLTNATPRFTDNGDGTVTDNNTGLIWLKNANVSAAKKKWSEALDYVAELNISGTMNGNAAGDTSNGGSHQTDWRLPNIKELLSLCNYGYFNPALSNASGTGKWIAGDPFTDIKSDDNYWSSTTYAGRSTYALIMYPFSGYIGVKKKADTYCYIWPVRGGE